MGRAERFAMKDENPLRSIFAAGYSEVRIHEQSKPQSYVVFIGGRTFTRRSLDAALAAVVEWCRKYPNPNGATR